MKATLKSQLLDWIRSQGNNEFTLGDLENAYRSFGGAKHKDGYTVCRIACQIAERVDRTERGPLGGCYAFNIRMKYIGKAQEWINNEKKKYREKNLWDVLEK